FLNGTDISSARSQELKNVNVVINERGDVFIIAPHYQVNEEDTYIPLSKYVQGLNAPVHSSALSKSQPDLPSHPGAAAAQAKKVEAAPSADPANAPLEKAGTDEKLAPEMSDKVSEDKE